MCFAIQFSILPITTCSDTCVTRVGDFIDLRIAYRQESLIHRATRSGSPVPFTNAMSTPQPLNEFATVEDKIEIAEGKKSAGDKSFREGSWQDGERSEFSFLVDSPCALSRVRILLGFV